MNLRWCGAGAAADAAARLGIENPRYRDASGTWWTVAGGRWEAWSDGAWHADQPPERVEGPADELPAAAESRAHPSNSVTAEQAVADAIPSLVRRIADSYHDGRLTSDAAETLLNRLYAIETGGSVWTVGVHSFAWFSFRGGRWERTEMAPDAALLVDVAQLTDDGMTAVREALAAFISADDLLPEQVTDPWPESPAPHTVAWRASHRVPVSGIQAWETPDANARPFGSLAGGLEVVVLERSGQWARVSTLGGQDAWVDGRLLVGT